MFLILIDELQDLVLDRVIDFLFQFLLNRYQQFVLYDRHAKPGANLGQRIDKIYKDNITKVSIKINKSTPKDLLETVKQEQAVKKQMKKSIFTLCII